MMKYDNEVIRKLQLKELEVLKVFHDVCRRNNLRYFAIGGTCLGAVRHKGFIPWDDDIDVAMPYEDCAKFLELAKTELPEGYAVLSDDNAKHFLSTLCSRVHDINSTFILPWEREYSDEFHGASISVLAMHGQPKGKFALKFISLFRRIYERLDRNMRLPFRFSDKPSVMGKVCWILCYFLKKFLPYNYFSDKVKKLINKYPFGCSDEITFTWRNDQPNEFGWYKRIFPYDVFSSAVELPFEDTAICVPVDYDKYLTMDFGSDYMMMPPEEQRLTKHLDGAIVDLEKSYKYYAAQKEAGTLICS